MRKLIDHARAMFRRLRCRPGDICWLKQDLRADGPIGMGQVLVRGGTVVTVTRIARDDIWLLAEPIHGRCRIGPFGYSFTVIALADDILIPLRDRPGQDQTLTAKAKAARVPRHIPVQLPAVPTVQQEA